MPEGPTIRHTADLLRDVLESQQIMRFQSPLKKATIESWAEKISGQSVRTDTDALYRYGAHAGRGARFCAHDRSLPCPA
jgi:hypothetical protein